MKKMNLIEMNLIEVDHDEIIKTNGGGRIARWAGQIVGFLHNCVDALEEAAGTYPSGMYHDTMMKRGV